MKRLIYTAALVALSFLSVACDCDPAITTRGGIFLSGSQWATNMVWYETASTAMAYKADDELKVPADYFYSVVRQEERLAYADWKNYSIQRRITTYRVMVWDEKGAEWDATRSRKTFASLAEAELYVHNMHTYYESRNNLWTTVWGKGLK